MTKSTRTAEQLKTLLLEHIEAIPELRSQETDVHRGHVLGTGGDGEEGPNSTVPVLSDRGTYRHDIAQIIRSLQTKFDLET